MIKEFGNAFDARQLATGLIAEKGMEDPEEAGAAATEYLVLFRRVALGFMWARSAVVAADRLAAATPRLLPQGQTDHGSLLRAARPASGRRLACRDQGRQSCRDGDGRNGVLMPNSGQSACRYGLATSEPFAALI